MLAYEPVTIDPKRVAELAEREEKRLEESTPKSFELYKRAVKSMPMGVASTYHARDPYPVYYTHGKGSDLLVMGAYGRGQVLSFLGMGGATGKVISSCRVPLLMAH